MKNIILLFLVSQFAFSQEKNEPTKIAFEPFFRLNIFNPIQTGNHSLAKDFDSKLGVNANLSLVSYGDFSFNTGYEFSQYRVTNFANIGEIEGIHFSTIYGEIDYDIPIYNKLKVIPNIGYGYVSNKYKSSSRRFGTQDGTEIRIGTMLNYNLTKTFSTFIGLNYIITNVKVNTNKEYEDYFGKATRFQVSLGVKFQ